MTSGNAMTTAALASLVAGTVAVVLLSASAPAPQASAAFLAPSAVGQTAVRSVGHVGAAPQYARQPTTAAHHVRYADSPGSAVLPGPQAQSQGPDAAWHTASGPALHFAGVVAAVVALAYAAGRFVVSPAPQPLQVQPVDVAAPWAMAAVSGLRVEPDADAVGKTLCSMVEAAAQKAIQERGHFTLAIPGGSILKMLAGLEGKSTIDWSKVTLAYVNHRAVPNHDDTATHFKAQPLFLSSWQYQGLNVITLTGTTDAEHEAVAYTNALTSLPDTVLPKNASGVPVFDMMLIGVGLDGHVGSLYPNSEAVKETQKLVIPVVKPTSSSITLSLPVMLASKQIVIASAGKSEKYPMGKAEGMLRALQAPETPDTFPACAFRGNAQWLLDEGAASLLSK